MGNTSNSNPSPFRRARHALLGTFIVYAVLVALHLGEFWPFSIYPMFSQAGDPWSRSVVRALPPDTDALPWDTLSADGLPGTPHALSRHGVDAIDLANYVSKTPAWDTDARRGLEQLFADQLDNNALLVFRARGMLDDNLATQIVFVPYALLRQDTTLINPSLPTGGLP